MKNATISLWADTDFSQATQSLLSAYVNHMEGSVSLLPSSLDAKDPFVGLVGQALPEVARPAALLPVSGAAARRAFVTPSVIGRWIDRPVKHPSTGLNSVTWPQELAQADHRIVVTDVVEVARKGPFVLDLPARYIHPRQRARLLASGQREAQAAEVASALTVELFAIYLAQRDGVILAVTTDVIAAELVALAMAELCVGAPRAFTGPWEDPVVQRATELELGVLLPDRIRIILDGAERASHWSQRIVEHIHMRLGVPNRGQTQ